jgi:hypothetical protein
MSENFNMFDVNSGSKDRFFISKLMLTAWKGMKNIEISVFLQMHYFF